LEQYALERYINNRIAAVGKGRMFIATTVDHQTIAEKALENTGFELINKKRGRYGSTINLWYRN
jgi:hypothetical protein